jgi:hypothetical protein
MYPFPFVPDMGKEPTELDPFSAGLYLSSIHVTISVRDALDQPSLGALVTDDFCWRMTLRDWRARRPSWRNRAERAAWRAERAVIERERESIELRAAGLGLAIGTG